MPYTCNDDETLPMMYQTLDQQTSELLQVLQDIANLQNSNDYPHVKAWMTQNMAIKAIAKATSSNQGKGSK
jgi:hypothetical protein